MNDLTRIKELYGLVNTKQDEFAIQMAAGWCARQLSMSSNVSTKLIYMILSAGRETKELTKIIKLLDDFDINKENYENFISMILKALNGNIA